MIRRITTIVLASGAAASAQILNPGFESGALSPWVLANTAAGGSVSSGIGLYDIDGPGPLPTNQAASFMVGRTGTSTSPEGVTLSQSIALVGNSDYLFSFDWSVHAFVNVYNASAGIFEFAIDGATMIQENAPTAAPGQSIFGQASVTFHAPASRAYTITLRILRNVPAGEEVVQYVDNINAFPACYANCDQSTAPPILNVNDFQCFLNAFASGTQMINYANCDQSTAPPVLNVNDFQCFLNAYAAGCT